jgi:hypothetical protein
VCLQIGVPTPAQVRFCRYRFSATGGLGYRGVRGAEGSDTGSLYKRSLIVNSAIYFIVDYMFVKIESKVADRFY